MRRPAVVVLTVALLGACRAAALPDPAKDYESLGNPAKCSFGPWSKHCSEAFWLRDVVAAAGKSVSGDTGSALESSGIYIWATDAAGAIERMDEVGKRAGIAVLGDGIRLVWQVHGLNVWAEAAQGSAVSVGDIDQFVAASREVPYP